MPLTQKHHYTAADYAALPENDRAELIDGQFYSQTAPSRRHQEILMEIAGSIRDYIKANKGSCKVYPAPFAVQLTADDKTVVEPDISVICDPNTLTERGCMGAPSWIIEIVSPASRRMDYYTKLSLYQASGVQEYWIVDPEKNVVLVYDMKNGDGPAFHPFRDPIQARVFHDLDIDISQFA